MLCHKINPCRSKGNRYEMDRHSSNCLSYFVDFSNYFSSRDREPLRLLVEATGIREERPEEEGGSCVPCRERGARIDVPVGAGRPEGRCGSVRHPGCLSPDSVLDCWPPRGSPADGRLNVKTVCSPPNGVLNTDCGVDSCFSAIFILVAVAAAATRLPESDWREFERDLNGG